MRSLGFLFDPSGRSGRGPMVIISAVFVLYGIMLGSLKAQGVPWLPVLTAFQFLLIWPALVAIPIRRFHDMGQPWWWVAIFLGLAILSFGFTWWELTATAPLVGMTAAAVFADADKFIAGITALNADRPSGTEPLKPLGGPGLGGISLAIIFLSIQFGWLHLIPGQSAANRFGPAAEPSTS